MHIVDRRANPSGKSLSNRQRFLKRARAAVRNAVKEASKDRSIRDVEQGQEISVPAGDVTEPTFRRDAHGGKRDYILPGNTDYVAGDEIERPEGGGGGSGGPGDDGGGEDEFRFVLSAKEFLDLYLEDLELPDLAKRRLSGEGAPQWRRAGYRTDGSPSSLSVPRTLRNSLARRIALNRPQARDLRELEEQIAALESQDAPRAEIEALREKLARMKLRSGNIAYIDPVDVRYRRLESFPTPVAQAVVFCLMDVSGSMDEHRKDLAKRFYALLYLFLKRRYDRVEVVFIRHTHEAKEVDEDTFFHSVETGGTIVSTALEEMLTVVQDRFPVSQWNIYAAQCSDGDNTASDNAKSVSLLRDSILPIVQYYAYLEVDSETSDGFTPSGHRASSLWRAYQEIASSLMAMRRASHRRDIYPVFRDLFARDKESVSA
jgi:uncharacterized sporulation protein YeaH/YhbH (DUF444 family)